MAKLNPYLRFNDEKCREAMTFYKECIGGELTFQTVGESGAPDMPAEIKDRIMHASLKNGGVVFYAADMMRDKAVVGDNVSLSLDCENEKEARSLFEKLSEGGEIFSPLKEEFWGSLFGMFTDKFGVEWMINFQLEK